MIQELAQLFESFIQRTDEHYQYTNKTNMLSPALWNTGLGERWPQFLPGVGCA